MWSNRLLKIAFILTLVIVLMMLVFPFPETITGASIAELGNKNSNFCFAVIGDTHTNLPMFNKIGGVIQKQHPEFVIINGDITNSGRGDEYKIMYSQMESLDLPVFTAIGNHDVRNNGAFYYTKFFGQLNYTFSYGGSKFIVLDSSGFEISSSQMEWLLEELSENAVHKFVITHVPILELNRSLMKVFSEKNVDAVIQSHWHIYSETVQDGVYYYITPSAGGLLEKTNASFGFLSFCVNDNEINVKKVDIDSAPLSSGAFARSAR